MMTQQLEISILAAPIAAIDRRALSEAWYSALRLERGDAERAGGGHRRPTGVAYELPVVRRQCHASFERSIEHYRAQSTQSASAPEPQAGSAIAPNRTVFPLSGRIERTFFRQSAPLRRATFSLGRGRSRVHVILQSTAGTVTLIALCRPEMRHVVARALAQARWALAARGIQFKHVRSGGKPCF
jgi:hypothetical protein